jgi:hypothetical protein
MEEVEVSTCEMLATVSLRNLGALAGNPIPQTWQSWPLLETRSTQYIAVIYLRTRISYVYMSYIYMLVYMSYIFMLKYPCI